MKYINKIGLLILGLLLLSSCEDYLDLSPDSTFSEADVYETYYTAQSYLDNCYRSLFDYQGYETGSMGGAQFECITDNAAGTAQWGYSGFISGDWYNKTSLEEVGWGTNDLGKSTGLPLTNASFCIRICNNLLSNIESIPSTGATQDQKDWLTGQAYFFRAWYYFEWIRRLGGMQAVNVTYTDNYDVPRQTYQESSQDIIEDLVKAYELLPDEWNDENQGRAEKCSALALKGMVALYAASPLMQNPIGQTTERNDYSQTWAEDAALYAAQTLVYLDSMRPDKNMIDPEGLTTEEIQDAWSNVQYHENYMGPEALWCKNHTSQVSAEGGGAYRNSELKILYWNIRVSSATGSWGNAISMPTQNLVDAFEMADGTLFDWSNDEHAANPYDNRDPRLYRTIVFPGEQYSSVGLAQGGDNGLTYHEAPAQHDDFYLETWTTQEGLYGLDAAYTSWTKNIPTGYMCKKWWWEDAYGSVGDNPSGYGTYKFNSEFIRTTQVWLDLAEALLEATGDINGTIDGYDYTALSAVNKVRNKGGMPDLDAGITTADLRSRIRNERRIELAFEYHRWFDLRRWMLFDEVFSENYPVKGISAVMTSTNDTIDQEQWDYDYEVIDILTATRNYTTKHYWYPIPATHTDQLYNTEQNYGW